MHVCKWWEFFLVRFSCNKSTQCDDVKIWNCLKLFGQKSSYLFHHVSSAGFLLLLQTRVVNKCFIWLFLTSALTRYNIVLCHLSVLDFCNVHYCLEGDSQAAEGTALYFEWSLVLLDRRKSFGKVLLFCMMSFQKKVMFCTWRTKCCPMVQPDWKGQKDTRFLWARVK